MWLGSRERLEQLRGGWLLVPGATLGARVRAGQARAADAARAWPAEPAVRRADRLAAEAWAQLGAPPCGRKRLAMAIANGSVTPGDAGREVIARRARSRGKRDASGG
jgi:hypothetical protein